MATRQRFSLSDGRLAAERQDWLQAARHYAVVLNATERRALLHDEFVTVVYNLIKEAVTWDAHDGKDLLAETDALVSAACQLYPSESPLLCQVAVYLASRPKGGVGRALSLFMLAERCGSTVEQRMGARMAWERVKSESIGQFHLCMVADQKRNVAFAAAIRRALHDEDGVRTVADLGAGTGLLSVMALAAGATRVIAVERQPLLAHVSHGVLAANNALDKVHVLEADATRLRLDDDGDDGDQQRVVAPPSTLSTDQQQHHIAQVDLVVSETLGAALIGELISTLLLAGRRHLLRKERRSVASATIPVQGDILACLVESPAVYAERVVQLEDGRRLALHDGFDPLATSDGSPFQMVQPFSCAELTEYDDVRYLSEWQTVFSIDWSDEVAIERFLSTERDDLSLSFRCTEPGTAHVVAVAFRARLHSDIWLCSLPEENSSWPQAISALQNPRPLAVGQSLNMKCHVSDLTIHFYETDDWRDCSQCRFGVDSANEGVGRQLADRLLKAAERTTENTMPLLRVMDSTGLATVRDRLLAAAKRDKTLTVLDDDEKPTAAAGSYVELMWPVSSSGSWGSLPPPPPLSNASRRAAVIPRKVRLYAALVESDWLRARARAHDKSLHPDVDLTPFYELCAPREFLDLPARKWPHREVSDTFVVWEMDLNGRMDTFVDRVHHVRVREDSRIDGVLYWHDLELDDQDTWRQREEQRCEAVLLLDGIRAVPDQQVRLSFSLLHHSLWVEYTPYSD